MSNELTMFGNQIPDYLRGGIDETTRNLAGSVSKRISIKGGAFREIVGGIETRVSEERTLQVVIVKAASGVARTFYDEQFQDGKNISPACYSSDGRKPDEAVTKPVHFSCEGCPKNAKGSGGNGTSKACRYRQLLAVMIYGEFDKGVYRFEVPAASLFGEGKPGAWPLQAYVKYVASNGIAITGVVTEIKFDVSGGAGVRVVFRPAKIAGRDGCFLTKDEFEAVERNAHSQEAIDATTLTFAPSTNADASEQPEQTKPFVQSGTIEPKVRASKKAEAEPAKTAEQLIADWTDD